jgi:hypothetical protein
MSAVNPPLQIVPHRDLNTTQARAITEQIKSAMGDLILLVAPAWQGRVWIALDYESWADYIKAEFGNAPLSLPREERKAVTSLLRGQGMSTRAIAPAVGVHHDTVASDLSTVGFPTVESEPVPITGLDGKKRPAKKKPVKKKPVTDDLAPVTPINPDAPAGVMISPTMMRSWKGLTRGMSTMLVGFDMLMFNDKRPDDSSAIVATLTQFRDGLTSIITWLDE